MIGLPTIVSSRMSARLIPARRASPAIERIERLAHDPGHLLGALGMHHHVRDPAHQVLAEADLGVHQAVRGEDRAVRQVGQVAGDRGRADVDRDPVGAVVEARPDGRHLVAVVDRHRHPVVAARQGPAGVRGSPRGPPRGRSGPIRARAPRRGGRGRRSATRARAGRPRRSGAGRPDRRRTRAARGPCGPPGDGPGSRAARRSGGRPERSPCS